MAIVVAMPPEGGPSAPPGTAPSAPPGTAPSAPPGKDMWSGVALENVRKNAICLVKDKTDANLAQLKRAGGHWHSKDVCTVINCSMHRLWSFFRSVGSVNGHKSRAKSQPRALSFQSIDFKTQAVSSTGHPAIRRMVRLRPVLLVE